MRDNPARMPEETAAAHLAPAHADAIEIFAEVLAQSEDEASSTTSTAASARASRDARRCGGS